VLGLLPSVFQAVRCLDLFIRKKSNRADERSFENSAGKNIAFPFAGTSVLTDDRFIDPLFYLGAL
jgi:hypothetical protein